MRFIPPSMLVACCLSVAVGAWAEEPKPWSESAPKTRAELAKERRRLAVEKRLAKKKPRNITFSSKDLPPPPPSSEFVESRKKMKGSWFTNLFGKAHGVEGGDSRVAESDLPPAQDPDVSPYLKEDPRLTARLGKHAEVSLTDEEEDELAEQEYSRARAINNGPRKKKK